MASLFCTLFQSIGLALGTDTKKALIISNQSLISFAVQLSSLVVRIKHHIVILGVSTIWLAAASKEASTFEFTLACGFNDHRTAAFFTKAYFLVRLNQINVCSKQTT